MPCQIKFSNSVGEVFDLFSLTEEEEFKHSFVDQDEETKENSDQLDEVNMLLYVKDQHCKHLTL